MGNEEQPADNRNAQLKEICCDLENKQKEQCQKIDQLKCQVRDRDRAIATGRSDGTGTDWPAECKKARAEKASL